jgi:hypothetical protein
MSTRSSESSVEINLVTQEDTQEFQNLPNLLTQWKRVQEEKNTLMQQKRVIAEQISEINKRTLVMETMIMGTMKKHSIGALDLKSSKARAVYKKRTTKPQIKRKDLMKHISEHLKSDEAAKDLIDFLDTKREIKVKETLVYEKVDTQ